MNQDTSLTHTIFFDTITQLIAEARSKTYRAINTLMVETYRNIGKMIVEEEQKGNQRAEYGKYLISQLSKKLTNQFGKGFSEQSLQNMRKFFLTFPISSAVRRELTRTHYRVLMRIEKPEVRERYIRETIERQLSVRQLERQIYTFTYERVLANKEQDIVSDEHNTDIITSKDILKDPYIFEFTGIHQDSDYHETDLEKALISNIESFLLELGK